MAFAEPVPPVPAVAVFVATLPPPLAVMTVPVVAVDPNVVAVPLTAPVAATHVSDTWPSEPAPPSA
jgi:hypothetical protein